MSTRERWIIYPLLFMTLGIAMRDKVVPPVYLGNPEVQVRAAETISQRVRCRELHADLIVCKRLDVNNGLNEESVVVLGSDRNTHAGVIETFNNKGIPQIRLFSTDTGGIVSTIGRAGRAALLMGDTGQTLGISVEVPELGVQFPLVSAPSRIEIKPRVSPQGPKSAAPPSEQPAEKKEESSEKAPPE